MTAAHSSEGKTLPASEREKWTTFHASLSLSLFLRAVQAGLLLRGRGMRCALRIPPPLPLLLRAKVGGKRKNSPSPLSVRPEGKRHLLVPAYKGADGKWDPRQDGWEGA